MIKKYNKSKWNVQSYKIKSIKKNWWSIVSLKTIFFQNSKVYFIIQSFIINFVQTESLVLI